MTQDPNKTQMSPPPSFGDPNRTVAMPGGAPGSAGNATVLGGAPFDPLKTQAMAGVPLGKAVSVNVIAGRSAAMANGPAREQVLLEIVAAGQPPASIPGLNAGSGTRTAVNLVLVIDRSGSMEGQPLEYVKMAANHVVDSLTQDDWLSIVTFETTADVLLPPSQVTSRDAVKAGIARLMCGNTTNLYDGVALGLQQATANMEGRRATRMVVLTDGDPTAGIKEYGPLTQLAADVKARGVSVTFLGFGPDYNEELLAGMARRAGGTYQYISRPEQLPEVFRDELGKLSSTVARNLRLQIKPARWVSLRAPVAGQSGQEVEMPLVDLERGATLTQVIDLDMPNHPLGWYRVAAGRLLYDDLVDGSTQSVDLDLVLEFTADAARYAAPQDPRVAGAAQVSLISKQVEKTVLGLKTGALDRTMALNELNKTQTLLAQEGRVAEAREVTMAMQAIQSGASGDAEKTLLGTVLNLDQGKK